MGIRKKKPQVAHQTHNLLRMDKMIKEKKKIWKKNPKYMTVELVKFWMSGLNDWSLGNSKVKNRLSFSSSFILPQKFDPKAIIWGPVKVKVAQSCPTLCDPMDYTVSGILPSQNTGVGSLVLLQGLFPTQGSNLGLPHWRWILYQLSHKGSPRWGQ